MSKFAFIIGAAAVIGVSSLTAFAQQRGVGADAAGDGRYLPAERGMMVFGFNGDVKTMKAADDKGHAEIMKNARALADGTAIYRSGGKFYLIENKKMASGKMLFDEMAGFMVEDRQAIGNR